MSREWVLTAGHNVDRNDEGQADALWSRTFQLPGYESFGLTRAFTHPAFTGFANPSVNDDLALLHLAVPLPMGMGFPTLGSGASIGDFVTLVGFGRSGYGSYGYTTGASLTDRRFGSNVIDSFQVDDEGTGRAEVFRYDFDAPASTGLAGGSLGNDIETIIGPGDSGGAALKQTANGWELVGINTFTEGYGGQIRCSSASIRSTKVFMSARPSIPASTLRWWRRSWPAVLSGAGRFSMVSRCAAFSAGGGPGARG